MIEDVYKVGLKLTQDECEVMRITSLEEMSFEEVEESVNLEAILSNKCDEAKEIDSRLTKANKNAGVFNF